MIEQGRFVPSDHHNFRCDRELETVDREITVATL